MGQGLVREIGKKADSAGRIPMVYDLEPTAGYFVGVNPEMDCLALAASDFCGNLITEKQKVPYVYENTPESLAEMGKIINVFIDNLPIKREEILEVCVNVAERVRSLEGRAYNMFTFLEEPLAEKLTKLLELPTCIENDSRSMTYGEFIKGCCKGKKDVIFVNVCWGLGIGIIIDGKLYYGKSGYSGEFGHMTAYNNNIICHCGKIGCIETEVSGRALKRKLTENILAGKPSILSDKVLKQKEELTLEDIMDAIAKEDVLSLATLQHIADELGKQLAGIINIFNPEMLVIGGEMSVTGDYLTLSGLRLDDYALAGNSKAIAFLSHLHGRRNLDRDISLLAAYGYIIAGRCLQLISHILCDVLAIRSLIRDHYLLRQYKLTLLHLCFHRHRDNINICSYCLS